MSKVILHDRQLEVAKDIHRFRIVCAGRRWGKSVLSRMIVLKWAVENIGLYWIVSPSYKQAKQIHWRDIQREIPREWVIKKNEVELSITLANGSIIELKGCENPDTLRGVKLRGLVIDEIASIRNWDWLWQEVLRPTLTDYEAPAIFISTPKGFNHFYELFLSGDNPENKLYKSWKFTSYDNPYISREEINAAREELTENTFAQEYLADFRKYTGLVYKAFERNIHVIEPFDIPDSWSIYRSFDFGSTNPTACAWLAVDGDDNMFLVSEHYSTGQIIEYHAGVINTHPLSKRVTASYGDPSGAQWIKEFAERNIFITPATRENSQSYEGWVRIGIERVAERLKPIPGHKVPSVRTNDTGMGLPRFYVFSSCKNAIREFETYRWKERSVTTAQDLNKLDIPEKANDHILDAIRYFVVSYEKPIKETPTYQWDKKVWRIGS